VITGHTKIGRDNRLFHFCSIGERTRTRSTRATRRSSCIGDRNTIREYVSINRGTVQDQGVTTVGATTTGSWLTRHVAHDCIIGNKATIANCTQLAGHVHIGDWATLGGFTGVHQYVKIGAHVMTGVSSVVLQDIPAVRDGGRQPARALRHQRRRP
jgi:UDP-N-acetylglucosamine acyltransferase